MSSFSTSFARVRTASKHSYQVIERALIERFLADGPLFPVKRYTLASTFLIPTACEIAIAVAATFLIFPQTLNSNYTTVLVDKFLLPILQRSHLHSKVLATPAPSYGAPHETEEDRAWKVFPALWSGTQEAMAGGLEGLLGMTGLLELEVSYGRLGAKDLAGLSDALRELLARSVGLAILSTTVSSRRKRTLAAEEAYSNNSSPSTHSTGEKEDKSRETARMHRFRLRSQAAEDRNQHTLPHLLPIFENASSPLRIACDEALLSAMNWLTESNSKRWFKRPKPDVVDQQASMYRSQVENLEHEIRMYRLERRKELVAVSSPHPCTRECPLTDHQVANCNLTAIRRLLRSENWCSPSRSLKIVLVLAKHSSHPSRRLR